MSIVSMNSYFSLTGDPGRSTRRLFSGTHSPSAPRGADVRPRAAGRGHSPTVAPPRLRGHGGTCSPSSPGSLHQYRVHARPARWAAMSRSPTSPRPHGTPARKPAYFEPFPNPLISVDQFSPLSEKLRAGQPSPGRATQSDVARTSSRSAPPGRGGQGLHPCVLRDELTDQLGRAIGRPVVDHEKLETGGRLRKDGPNGTRERSGAVADRHHH